MPLRAVVDAQVWVRTVLHPKHRSAARRIREALGEVGFTLIASEPLLGELDRVLRRSELRRKYDDYPLVRVELLLKELRIGAEVVEVPGTLKLCRDPKDDAVIETAVVGKADLLVTDDQDLQAAEVVAYLQSHGCRVVGVGDFVRELYPPELEDAEE